MAVSSGTSFALASVLTVLIFSGMQMYKQWLSSTQIHTIFESPRNPTGGCPSRWKRVGSVQGPELALGCGVARRERNRVVDTGN
uniref:Uncharacterized protein n=1 Tax=Timema douglasi TaxID=61478 RepID=A0A7R8VLY7_TIMDO|nr:unnamed protein product [Timema douglasi]